MKDSVRIGPQPPARLRVAWPAAVTASGA